MASLKQGGERLENKQKTILIRATTRKCREIQPTKLVRAGKTLKQKQNNKKNLGKDSC